MKVIDLKACTDCAAYLANGEFPPEWNEEEIHEYISNVDFRWPPAQWSLCSGNAEGDDEGDEFSWASCGVCGSYLGGARHPAHAIER